MSRLRPTAIASVLLAAACAATPPAPTPRPEVAAAATITAADVLEHVSFLAGDELRGRDTPSPGLERAAEYLVERFAELGLEPAGDGDTYVQRWPYRRAGLRADETAAGWSDASGNNAWAYADEFFALPSQTAEAEAEAVYAGVAGAAPPPEVRGRIALVDLPGMGVLALQTARAAAQAGAAGVVFLLPEAASPAVIAQAAAQAADGGAPVQQIPVVAVRPPAAAELFASAGVEHRLASAPAVLEGVRVRLRTPVRVDEHQPPNVIAALRGSDPALRDTWVVYSAHFDHVGVGRPDETGDSIYNGADDDASGTAAVLEAAEAFASLPRSPRRSVLFLLVSGEEKGLLGSRFFVENPTVPLEGIVANINMDMVGRNAPDTVVGIGQDYTTLGPLAHRLTAEHPDAGLTIIQDPNPAEQAFFRSDHVHFVRKEIPAIFFSTWLHEDYHRPSDEVEAIDEDKLARVARLVFYVGEAVANDPQPPRWTEDGLAEVRELMRRLPF